MWSSSTIGVCLIAARMARWPSPENPRHPRNSIGSMFDPASSRGVQAARFMRLAAGLLLAALGLTCARPATAGWTVNATGDCVPVWVAPPEAQGPVAMLNAPALPLRSAIGGGQVAASGDQGK